MNYDPIGDDEHTDRMEREQVVKWLRERAKRHSNNYLGVSPSVLADEIEKGEHYTDENPSRITYSKEK